MKCYLINLDRSKDRLAQMDVEFGRLGLSFTRVAAVDGRLLSQGELDAVTAPVRRWEIPMPPGEIGCFLSHKKCLEIIAQGEDDYAAVFEDDIVLSGQAQKILSDSDWIPADADLIKIETFNSVILLGESKKIQGTDCKYARLLSKHLCTGGYIVSRSAAKRMLQFMQQISVPVDNLMFDPQYEMFSSLNIYQIYPAICKQMGFESLIEADRKTLRKQYKHRPSFPGLVVREIVRSYNRSSHILSPTKLWTRITSKKRWLRVSFKP
ncbi:glycosyltransferase family 25 protein [Pseudochrobactrum kiredjianiae]|uniref:Glycosyltransferase family 25 protein n=1 Tax=Pseudochrobactrum kiredjianiae TaxID=386305 RepID=A0ABW3V0P7_9HYPH|nr:glycosyltransferase family 25 protein [Pseudochrobactrum kiredjianiae]MDM7852774.1 glycosyltransferase family 25 protein [Pseudochrobactrum kiredjianiae]